MITLIVTAALLAVGYRVGMDLRIGSAYRESYLTRLHGTAGTELALYAVSEAPLWRTDVVDPWLVDVVDETSFTVVLSDPVDGQIAPDGTSFSTDADTIRVTTTATRAELTRSFEVDCVPLPHEALRFTAAGISSLALEDGTIEGRVMSRGTVNAVSATVRGDVYAESTTLVDPTLDDADTDIIRQDPLPGLPVPDLKWFVDAGEEVTVPSGRAFEDFILSKDGNPRGTESPDGIYWMDAAGGDLRFHSCGIDACLVILNAGTVRIQNSLGGASDFHHHSPDPDRLPALIVDGDVIMNIQGGTATYVITSGLSLVPFTPTLRGVFMATGMLRGPQTGSGLTLEVEGAFLADDLQIVGSGLRLRHDPDLNLSPLVELTGTGIRPLPGTAREVG
jgi:hypothetical protein